MASADQQTHTTMAASQSPYYLVGGTLNVPLMLWGRKAPTHRISLVHCMPDARHVLTASVDGQIVIWRLESEQELRPRYMLFAHEAGVSVLSSASTEPSATSFVSADKIGKMCLWEVTDGRCLESVTHKDIHTSIKPHNLKVSDAVSQSRLFCVGQYADIVVMDPDGLMPVFRLSSRVEQNWMHAICLLKPQNRYDVCIGISQSGMVKIWTLTDIEKRNSTCPIYEDESRQIRRTDARALVECPFNQRCMLVVCASGWQVYDASDFGEATAVPAPAHCSCVAGAFVKIDKVAIACTDGNLYLYQLPRRALLGQTPAQMLQMDKAMCYCVLRHKADSLAETSAEGLALDSTAFIRRYTAVGTDGHTQSALKAFTANRTGQMNMWRVPEVSDKSVAALMQQKFDTHPTASAQISTSLQQAWGSLLHEPPGVMDDLPDWVDISCTLYVASQARLFLGRVDGAILLLHAPHALVRILFHMDAGQAQAKDTPMRVLSGHTGAVTCLLYPHEHSPRYEQSHLLSGGVDFAVLLWDLNTGTRVQRFCFQAGPITNLMVPPEGCNMRINTSICSVAADHSVALISLKELRCILLASKHIYPVKRICWRPLDDFLLVQCEDNTLYVWQMETATLDRIVTGLLVEEIIAASDEQVTLAADLCLSGAGDDADSAYAAAGGSSGVAVQMLRAIKHKNMDVVKRIAADAMQVEGSPVEQAVKHVVMPAMHVHGVRSNTHDSESHLVVFSIEALIMGLLADEHVTMSGADDADSTTTSSGGDTTTSAIASMLGNKTSTGGLHDLLSMAKDRAESALKLSPAAVRKNQQQEAQRKKVVALAAESNNICCDVAQMVLSLLHAWTLDKDLDHVCLKKLGLLKPKAPLCFGFVSRHGHYSVTLPSGAECVRTPKVDATDAALFSPGAQFDRFAARCHWSESHSLTTNHLLGVIAVANTMMTMQHGGFLPEHEKKRRLIRRMSTISAAARATGQMHNLRQLPEMNQAAFDQLMAEGVQLKQGWSLLAALHCVLLPELVKQNVYKAPRLELLARRWQDMCVELREAAQALLLRELHRLGPAGRKQLVRQWAAYLPSRVDPNVCIYGPNAHMVGATVTAVQAAPAAEDVSKRGPNANVVTPLEAVTSLPAGPSVHELRRKQATALVLFGVLGAEFGSELAPPPRRPPPPGATDQETAAFQQQLREHGEEESYAYATCQSLTSLLSQPASAALPMHSPLRRACIDLMGRGFIVWQPYVDMSKVVIDLLDICANADRLLPEGVAAGLAPLSPEADACRTARHALMLIASARPPAFIVALDKEVGRYNAAAQHQTLQHTAASPLLRARNEVLRIVEQLIEKNYNDVVDMMIPLGNVLVHCLDTSLLKARSLPDVYPPIARFNTVSYCASARRIAFAGRNGVVAIHELRANRAHSVAAHSRAIAALAISEDGKYMATYSSEEAQLKMWHASAGFLGMGQSSVKCVKALPAPGETPGSPQGPLRARLVWISPKALTLMLPNGKEHRFSM